LASLADCDSVRLFVERAALSQSTFALTASTAPAVAQICHRVDGIPLAIEFAAARVRVLSVEQIASRLDDRFGLLRSGAAGAVPRHQTLRAATDWSYALLSEPERTVLRRCSVFAGGWTVDAAEDVCSGGAVERVEVLELFSSLIDKSLITANMRDREARYRLLETIRQYGSERLEESGEVDSVRSRHQAWCLALAEEAAPELWGPRQALWLARLEREHDNLRAALEWSLAEANGSEAALRLSGALHIFWIRHGHWREGRDWTDSALARIDGRPTPAVLMALHGATNLALKQSDYSCARAHGEMGLRRSRESGNEEMAAWFLFRLAQVASKQEDYDRATALLAESLDLSHDRALASLAPGLFGSIAWRRGDYDGAVAWLTKGLELLKEAGDIWHVATAYSELGYLARLQGDHARAVAFYKQGLALCRTLGDRWTTQECLVGLAFVACANHEYERAAQLFAVSEASYEDLRWERSAVFQATVDQEIAHARWGLGEKDFACAWAAGRAMTLEQAIEYGLGTERQRIGPQA
jgi:non-specific serine/threonine protein kinase